VLLDSDGLLGEPGKSRNLVNENMLDFVSCKYPQTNPNSSDLSTASRGSGQWSVVSGEKREKRSIKPPELWTSRRDYMKLLAKPFLSTVSEHQCLWFELQVHGN
jgi:hypothetical protein